MVKDFHEFHKMMGFRFPNDIKDLLEASEKAGQPLTAEELGAAYSVTMYLLKQYHDWLNES